ncbi:hypothetical protein CDV36_005508 [Fusarium kuroshium]|uniref:Uncharacterized protein n=1 Tax=Fusarium kuroshium TaxID=2010991 RepID=A0A3M2SBA1_9HYPO|nr:hypothetical protein CDV36_005508 [Fusarium kuroshium]
MHDVLFVQRHLRRVVVVVHDRLGVERAPVHRWAVLLRLSSEFVAQAQYLAKFMTEGQFGKKAVARVLSLGASLEWTTEKKASLRSNTRLNCTGPRLHACVATSKQAAAYSPSALVWCVVVELAGTWHCVTQSDGTWRNCCPETSG